MARRYEDLEARQLADQLRQKILALTETGPAAKDFKFRNQIHDAVSSAARNIAEGFGRFRPSDFARFMEYSIGSTMEVRDLITEGFERKYFTVSSTKIATNLVRRSLQVSRRLLLYLKRCRTDPPASLREP
jgi:four helix bundle protein